MRRPVTTRRARRGSLTIVGTGYRIGAHVSVEARARLRDAQELHLLVHEPAHVAWLSSQNRRARSLLDTYVPGRSSRAVCDAIVARVLERLRAGVDVCVACDGHPTIYSSPIPRLLARARREGFRTEVLPAISAIDCLWADLGVDPGGCGFQVFEATDLLLQRRGFDPRSHLVLLQVGAIGCDRIGRENRKLATRLRALRDRLRASYPRGHVAILYEIAPFSICAPRIRRVELARLDRAQVSFHETLYVPPRAQRPSDREMARRLEL